MLREGVLQPLESVLGPHSQLVPFEGRLQQVEEVVCMLLCSRMSEAQVFTWLERRLEVGRFSQ